MNNTNKDFEQSNKTPKTAAPQEGREQAEGSKLNASEGTAANTEQKFRKGNSAQNSSDAVDAEDEEMDMDLADSDLDEEGEESDAELEGADRDLGKKTNKKQNDADPARI